MRLARILSPFPIVPLAVIFPVRYATIRLTHARPLLTDT